MPAILKEKHFRFCDSLQGIRERHHDADAELIKLENELNSVYKNYQEQIDDLKSLIAEYNKKQQEIRNKIKVLLRKKAPVNGINEYSS